MLLMMTWSMYLPARILANSIWSEKLSFLEICNIDFTKMIYVPKKLLFFQNTATQLLLTTSWLDINTWWMLIFTGSWQWFIVLWCNSTISLSKPHYLWQSTTGCRMKYVTTVWVPHFMPLVSFYNPGYIRRRVTWNTLNL